VFFQGKANANRFRNHVRGHSSERLRSVPNRLVRGGPDGIDEFGVAYRAQADSESRNGFCWFSKDAVGRSCHISLVCDLDFLHFVSELRVRRGVAVLNDCSSGTTHSGVLLWSVRSSMELKRERPDLLEPLFDSRPTRPSKDEGAKIEVTKHHSNPT
jgi:hypothetical protein